MKQIMTVLAMSAIAVLLLAPAALAQGSAPPALQPMPGFNQPDYLNPAFDNPDIPGAGATAPASPDAKTSPVPTASPDATTSPGATASPSVTASPSAPASTTATSSASVLPDTGGTPLSPVLAVVAFLVLLASGGLVLRFTGSRGAAS